MDSENIIISNDDTSNKADTYVSLLKRLEGQPIEIIRALLLNLNVKDLEVTARFSKKVIKALTDEGSISLWLSIIIGDVSRFVIGDNDDEKAKKLTSLILSAVKTLPYKVDSSEAVKYGYTFFARIFLVTHRFDFKDNVMLENLTSEKMPEGFFELFPYLLDLSKGDNYIKSSYMNIYKDIITPKKKEIEESGLTEIQYLEALTKGNGQPPKKKEMLKLLDYLKKSKIFEEITLENYNSVSIIPHPECKTTKRMTSATSEVNLENSVSRLEYYLDDDTQVVNHTPIYDARRRFLESVRKKGYFSVLPDDTNKHNALIFLTHGLALSNNIRYLNVVSKSLIRSENIEAFDFSIKADTKEYRRLFTHQRNWKPFFDKYLDDFRIKLAITSSPFIKQVIGMYNLKLEEYLSKKVTEDYEHDNSDYEVQLHKLLVAPFNMNDLVLNDQAASVIDAKIVLNLPFGSQQDKVDKDDYRIMIKCDIVAIKKNGKSMFIGEGKIYVFNNEDEPEASQTVHMTLADIAINAGFILGLPHNYGLLETLCHTYSREAYYNGENKKKGNRNRANSSLAKISSKMSKNEIHINEVKDSDGKSHYHLFDKTNQVPYCHHQISNFNKLEEHIHNWSEGKSLCPKCQTE